MADRETMMNCGMGTAKMFGSWFCKENACDLYRVDDDGIGQKRCQITGRTPGNQLRCSKFMDKEELERNMM